MRLPVFLPLLVVASACSWFPDSPERLAFLDAPPATMVATDSQPRVRVAFLAADGDIATGIGDSVILRVVAPGSPAQTAGSVRAKAVAGVATFDVKVLSAGTALRFEATTARFATPVQSDPFTVAPGAPVAIHVERTGTIANWVGAPNALLARIADAVGNTVPSASATISMTSAAELRGTLSAVTSAGVAALPDLAVCASGITTRLGSTTASISAHAPGLAAGSVTMELFAGTATRVVWLTQPTSGQAGVTLPNFEVVVQDCGGNPVYGSLALGWGVCVPVLEPNSSGASIVSAHDQGGLMGMSWAYGYNTHSAVDVAGSGYRMVVTCTGPRRDAAGNVTVASAPSAPFDVSP